MMLMFLMFFINQGSWSLNQWIDQRSGQAGTPAATLANLLHRFAALEPQLHGGTFEGFIVSFVFAGDLVFVVHSALCV
jgi:hypothetical protein